MKDWIIPCIVSCVVVLFIPCHTVSTSHSLRHHRHTTDANKDDAEANLTFTHQDSDGGGGVYGISHITELVAKQGQEVVLACELNVTGESGWLQNGRPIKETPRMGRLKGDTQLVITSVMLQDDGIWQCQDKDAAGFVTTSKPVWIVVMDTPMEPYMTFDGNKLTAGQTISVKENSALTVLCTVDGGNPAPSVDWLFATANFTNASDTVSDYSRVEKVYHTKSELRLEKVIRAHHNSSVTCIARHALLTSPINTTIYLNVLYSPSFGISREPGFGFPLREGIPVSLKCDVDSNPPSNPVWLKDDGATPVTQTEDGYLNFTAIKREFSGWYKCTAHHLLGEFSSIGYFLNVRYEAEITQQPPREVEVKLGDSVQLMCGADGKPPPALCWDRVAKGGRLETVGSGPELALDKILYQEAGTYRCIAKNRVGLEERRAETHNVDVVVTGRPVVYPINKTLMAIMGKPLSLSVEFCANPPASRVMWLTERLLLRPGDVVDRYIAHNLTAADSPHCFLAMLTISEVTGDHAGEYLFLVKSPRGLAEGTVILNVTRASFSVSTTDSLAAQILVHTLAIVVHRFFMRMMIV